MAVHTAGAGGSRPDILEWKQVLAERLDKKGRRGQEHLFAGRSHNYGSVASDLRYWLREQLHAEAPSPDKTALEDGESG